MTSTAYNQSGDYIPRRDSAFVAWGNKFASLLSEDPSRFGLTQADADLIALWAGRFEEAYVPSQMPSKRTSTTVRAKNDLRGTVESIYREYAQRVKHHAGITHHDLSMLGLHIDDTGKTPIGPPRSAPQLQVVFSKTGGHIVYYSDENSPVSSRKPPGVVLLQLFAAVGPRGLPINAAAHVGDYGRQPIRIQSTMLPAGDGRVVTYYGRWVTRKGLKGPWSAGKEIALAVLPTEGAAGGASTRPDHKRKMQLAA